MIGRILLAFITAFSALGSSYAQELEMADTMESGGKIYVVLGVILMIFSGIILYIFQTGRRVKELEDKLNDIEGKA